jgi:hypothetical protein
VVKPISPYLLRPLRTLEVVVRELGQRTAGDASAEPSPQSPAEIAADKAPTNPANPKDSITIGGVDVPVEPGGPSAPSTGGQIDVKV